MVRLKDAVATLAIRHGNIFQFQYGSIKSFFLITHFALSSLFQFQYGSIKSFNTHVIQRQ